MAKARAVLPVSVNYFVSRVCNYKCSFCFHTDINSTKLTKDKALEGLRLLRNAGCEKINFAGGEPFMHPALLGSLCKESAELGMAVSIISNGSLIRPRWMDEFAKYVDILGVSADSFIPETNAAIGRGGDANNKHAERVMQIRELCARHDVLFKINTVVNALNKGEDMNAQIAKLDPYRWKVFQVLILKGENAGGEGDLRDARPLTVTRQEFDAFVARHSAQKQLIPEYVPPAVCRQYVFCTCSALLCSAVLYFGANAALLQILFNLSLYYYLLTTNKTGRTKSCKTPIFFWTKSSAS